MMSAGRLSLALALGLLGCQPPEQPPLPVPGPDTVQPASPAPVAPTSSRPARSWNTSASPVPAAPAPTPEPGTFPTTNPAEPPPDPATLTANQLHDRFPAPSACFSKRAAGDMPETLSIQVSASVMPSGTILHASVGGSTFTPEERACLEKLVLATRLDSPSDGAPHEVHTTVELRQSAPKPTAP